MPQKLFAFDRHNHNHCISSALTEAQELCNARSARLTPQRRQVLELIWQSHKPLGAYALMDQLAALSTRRVAPPTVYRALDFLMEQGLIHRINGLNAFVGCPTPNEHHQSHFLLCRHCGVAKELDGDAISQVINKAAQEDDFFVENTSLEVTGLCPHCRSHERD